MEASEKLEYVERYVNGVSAHDIEAIKVFIIEEPRLVGRGSLLRFYCFSLGFAHF